MQAFNRRAKIEWRGENWLLQRMLLMPSGSKHTARARGGVWFVKLQAIPLMTYSYDIPGHLVLTVSLQLSDSFSRFSGFVSVYQEIHAAIASSCSRSLRWSLERRAFRAARGKARATRGDPLYPPLSLATGGQWSTR